MILTSTVHDLMRGPKGETIKGRTCPKLLPLDRFQTNGFLYLYYFCCCCCWNKGNSSSDSTAKMFNLQPLAGSAHLKSNQMAASRARNQPIRLLLFPCFLTTHLVFVRNFIWRTCGQPYKPTRPRAEEKKTRREFREEIVDPLTSKSYGRALRVTARDAE